MGMEVTLVGYCNGILLWSAFCLFDIPSVVFYMVVDQLHEILLLDGRS